MKTCRNNEGLHTNQFLERHAITIFMLQTSAVSLLISSFKSVSHISYWHQQIFNICPHFPVYSLLVSIEHDNGH